MKKTLLILALCACGWAQAGEHGIRLMVASLPTDYDMDYGSGEDDSASRWSLMYHFLARPESSASFTISTGLEKQSFKDQNFRDTFTGARVEPGVSFNFHENFRLEVVGSLAFGVLDNSSDSARYANTAVFTELGVAVRPIWRITPHVELLAHAAWIDHSLDYTYDNNYDDGNYYDDKEVDRSGLSLGAGIGFHF